jgi:hypothetical protein
MDFAAYLAVILALGVTVTKAVDLIRNAIDPRDAVPKFVWNVAAFGVGIVFALGWSVDIINPGLALIPAIGEKTIVGSTAAEVLSGFVLGGVAGFWHEALDALSARGTPKASTT